MSLQELRAKYGENKKARVAVNAAMRAELPGGTEAIEALSRIQTRHLAARTHGDPAAKELEYCLQLVQTITDAMRAEIVTRYELKPKEASE